MAIIVIEKVNIMSYSEIDAGSVLANRGLNGLYGYGFGGNGNFLGDGSAINANVMSNRDLTLAESINRTGADRALSQQVATQGEFLTDRIFSQSIDFKFQNVSNNFAGLERILFAQQAETNNRLNAIDLKQTECCCELRAGQAALLAQINCNREVAEARQAGKNEAILNAILANTSGE